MGGMCINEAAIPIIAQMLTALMSDRQESVSIRKVMDHLPEYDYDLDTVDFNVIDKAIALAGFRRKCDGDDDTGRTYRAIR